MTQLRWIKGTYNGVYTEMREDGPWTCIEHVCDETCAHTIDVGPLFDSREVVLLRHAVRMCIVRNDVLGLDPKDRPALEALERKLTRHAE